MANLVSLSIERLSKSYGRTAEIKALDDFSMEFPAGKCTVMLGPSGCGKTTVLRSIAGLIVPDAGRICIGGETAFDHDRKIDKPPEQRHLGMVFQSYALWPHMTVEQNIAYPLLKSKLSKAEIARKAGAMLEWVGLGGMGGRFVHELSGGQQQRISLARAMVGNPAAILFDEPLSNLDTRLRERMRLELLALREKVPFTSIYVTHDLLEAMTLGDQVVVMRAGQIEQIGPPEDVYRRPRNRFTAEFVGIENLLPGSVVAADGGRLLVETVIGRLEGRAWSDRAVGSRGTVAIRATQLSLADQAGTVRGTVVRSAFQGWSNIHVVDIGGTEIVVESVSEQRHHPGEAVGIVALPGSAHALLDD